MSGIASSVATRPTRRGVFHPIGLPGIMARQDFFGQMLFVVTVQMILLLVAISIDLAKYFDQVMSSAADADLLGRIGLLAHYLGLRVIDIETRLLPIGVFVGVLMFEVWSILTRRRAIHWVSGRHPLRVLVPATAVGLVFGLLQYQMDVSWRPWAVLTQAAEKLGAYGERYERGATRKSVWIRSADRLVRARVRFGPPAELVEVEMFRLDEAGRIREVLRAERAEPTGWADLWRFHGTTAWTRDPENPASMRVTVRPRDELVAIPLHPLAVTYLGLPAKYVPDDDLRAIVASKTDMLVGADHRVWLEVRRANALMPLAMALLATVVSLFAGATRPTLTTLVGCAFAGYALHVGNRVFVAAGELERLEPVLAAWGPVLAALAAVPLLAAIAALRQWRA